MHLSLFSTGVFTQDLAMFGNSWAEEEPQLGRCPVVPSLYPSPCAMQDPRVLLVQHTKTHMHTVYTCPTPTKASFTMIHLVNKDSGSSLQKVEEVCATLLKEPFQSCHEFVSPYSYMASCSNDLCL